MSCVLQVRDPVLYGAHRPACSGQHVVERRLAFFFCALKRRSLDQNTLAFVTARGPAKTNNCLISWGSVRLRSRPIRPRRRLAHRQWLGTINTNCKLIKIGRKGASGYPSSDKMHHDSAAHIVYFSLAPRPLQVAHPKQEISYGDPQKHSR